MINSSLKEKYWDSATDKQMVISVVGTNQKIDNSMLEIGTFSLEESLCSESELKFGACEANCVKFTARNTAGSIIGKTISIEETIDGDSENPMPYGVFKVASDVPTADRTKRQITAYDAMYDIINTDVKSWYAGLSFPMTLRQFRNSFFAHLGIEQEVAMLPNDSMTVNKTLVATQTDDSSAVTEESAISGKTVVTAICEINGCFGNINREGKFEYVFLKAITSALYPAEDLFPADNVFPSDTNTESMTGHYITFDYEDFQSKAITQLEIKTSEDNAGAIVGTAGNNYSITGNFLVSDKTGAELEQIANNVLPIMAQAAYTPIKSCTTVGNPCLELGDPIRFNTSREIVETYLLQRTLTGVQSKRDSISAQGTQTHSAKVNSIRDTIESVERRTGKLERNADHLQSTYEDLEKQTSSKFEQTADAIEAEVINRQNADSEMSTKISQTAHSIGLTATGGEKSVGIVIQLYDENGNIIDTSSDNANIQITGVVTFNDLANAGSTTINGANITTGTINCDLLDGGTIKGQKLEGCKAEFDDGAESLRLKYSDDYYMGFRAGYIYCHHNNPGNIYQSIVFDNLMKIGVNSNADCWGNGSGSIEPTYYMEISKYGGINFNCINLTKNNSAIATVSDIPDMSNYAKSNHNHSISSLNYTLTDAKNVYFKGTIGGFNYNLATTGWCSDTFQKKGSDFRLKKNISDLVDITDFYMKLKPKRYEFKDGLRGYDSRVHYGFIAQDIASIEPESSNLVYKKLCDDDLSNEREVINDDYVYYVDKDELHAMHVQMIQKQHKEIEQLKQDNISLKGEVDILKQILGKMEEMLNVINSKIN